MTTVGALASRGGGRRLELVGGRGGWLRRRVTRAVALVLVASGCAAALVALSGSAVQHAAGARRGLASLPAAAQGPVSAALGRGEPAYRVAGLRARNPAQRLRVGFSRAGVAIASGRARFRIGLSAYGYSSSVRPLAFVAPVASANRVSYRRGSLSEWYANGPLGLEQGFDVAARPRAGGGPLTFSLALSGNLAAKLDHGSVLLAGKGVALRYRGLVASDARGRALRSWLELVGGHVLIRVDDRGAVYPLRVDPFVQQAELTAGDGAADDKLGGSVAVSGDTIVAGARFHNAKRGALYVFVRPATGWANATQTTELIASDGAMGDELGVSVAVSANTIVAGARYHTVGSNTKQGAAYVFVMPAAGWSGGVSTQTAELTDPGGAMDDNLGRSVAISGDTVVAGAPNRDGLNAGTGAAYVFTKPASGWAGSVATPGELLASDGATGDGFGGSVAASGNTVIAGASAHPVGSNKAQGAAYVFVMPGSGWPGLHHETAELTASDGATADQLGGSVAVSGNTVVAGARNHTGLGAAYVFVMPALGWAGSVPVTAELTAADGAAFDALGTSVAISGNTVIAGTGNHSSNVHQDAVYAFLVPPSITLGSPANGAVYTRGEAVTAAYSCTAPAGATVTTCAGPVANGAPIDTLALGSHTFTVNALDSDGATASESASYTVAAAGGTDTTAPVVHSAAAVPRTFAVDPNGRAETAVSARARRGTTFRYRLSEAARVVFTIERPAAGRKSGKKCVRPSRKNRKKRKCTRYLFAGRFAVQSAAGRNSHHFSGRIGRRKLRPGRYRVTLAATDAAGNVSAVRRVAFRIVKN
ncbi:MAG: hypothetical protein QOC77_2511 [Thermoleophilaceae bacterium]|nr:hypothetical protein [Thermoleophilaceae bacterium]